MISINLYQPGKINIDIPFPENWNELCREELMAIAKRQLTVFKTIHEQMAAVFNDILLIRARPFKKKLPDNFNVLFDPEEASAAAMPMLEFLYKENRLTKQLLPVIKLPGRSTLISLLTAHSSQLTAFFHGPEADFNNITCGEYEDAEIFFGDFISNPRTEPLAHLAAVLYRPKNTPYMAFNRSKNKWVVYNHERRYQSFVRLPQHILYSIYIWYNGCRSMLPLLFPTVYKKEGKSNDSEPDLLVFTKCIHSAAGPKNGSRDDIRRTLLKEFFLELELEAIHAEKLLEEYKKNGND